MILGINGIISVSRVITVSDTDAQAFINAAVITDTTQANAINTLVTDLKSANIWTKMKAIYPFVGGTASSHKFNLKDPRDLDVAYRLVFNGGWTHSSTGALPNGSNAYADSKLAPNVMSQNSIHLSFYSRTNISGLYIDMGSLGSISATEFIVSYNAGSGIASYSYMNTLSSDNSLNSRQTTGLYIGNRATSNSNVLFQNNIKVVNGTKSSLTPSTYSIYLGAENDKGVAGTYSPRQQAFASIGDGLSDSEATALYNAVNAYQVALSRNI